MNNTIEFVVKMRDMMGGGLNRLSSTSQSAFSRMSASAQGMTNRNQVLGMSFNELQKKIQQVESSIKSSTIPSQIADARRELAALQRQSAGHAGNMGGGASAGGTLGIGGVAIGSMLGGFAMQAGSAIVGAVGSGVSAMITKSMEKEQAITGLTTFLGKQGATDAYKNIRQDADVTPFDTASLLEVNRALISAGINAKNARSDAMNLANAVSAVGGGNDVLSRMAANMQQIKTVGKATAMDIRQFGIAGINIYEMIHRSTGKSIAQVKEMDVSYADLSKAIAMANSKGGIYDGAMAAQSQTMSGKWSTVKDKFGNAASDIGDAFSPVFNKLLDLGIKFANNIAPALAQAQPYIEMLSNGVGMAVDYIMQMVNGTSEWSGWIDIVKSYFFMIWEHTQKIAMKLWHIVSGIIEFVKKSEILKDVFKFIIWVFEKSYQQIEMMMDGIVWLWDNVLKPILEALDGVYKWIKGVDDVEVKATKTIISKKPKPTDEPKPDSPLALNTKLTNTNNTSGKTAGDTVTGGGPKVVNIYLGKFFDNIQFTTLNSGETAQELENIVTECLGRVLYNGSKLV
ncbi:tape measure protein [Flavobacterium psychrophilum]|uniref:tape measure protein n=1 Tax=Flavobacterium psychrophilum TaxID=96345 RepID=UPI00117A57B2|nr:tape measure protein [Flavobacterium psychrophilum]